MKLPVIRGKIGDWVYYSGLMTFSEVSNNVSASISEIYHATCLDELLQRDLTENYISIKQYLLNDGERFFNALILAIFDGDPQWLEVEFPEAERDYTNVGFLQFNGSETIFPVDGQHRVKGIMEALKENPSLANEQVSVIFIAHHQTDEGRKRTRKLFSTLNRRSKPVGQNENIALDEDDVCAIVTRELLQTNPLFLGKNIANTKNKSIPTTNKTAFTSLITLYQVVYELIQWKYVKEGNKKTQFKKFLLFRPEEVLIGRYIDFVEHLMNDFIDSTEVIKVYLGDEVEEKAEKFRNSSGGNILFRPVVLTEYFSTALSLVDYHNYDFKDAFSRLALIEMELDKAPWKGFLWDGEKIINRTSRAKMKSLLLFMSNRPMLTDQDCAKLFDDYAKILNISVVEAESLLLPSALDY